MRANFSIQNDEKIMVSVCCATYNHEKYIEDALKGFVNQKTNFKYEVIVHDDASTDGTREIIKKYVEQYPELIVPIYQNENLYSKGRGAVTQNMFSKVRGRYIAMCEGDDFWCDENKLQKQVEILEKHPECSICVHAIREVYGDGHSIEKKLEHINNKLVCQSGILEIEDVATMLWKEGRYPFHTSSYCIRKEVLKARIENKEVFLKYMNGDMVTLRLSLMHGKFYYMTDIMSCRRRDVEGSWNARWKEKNTNEKLQYFQGFLLAEEAFDIYSGYKFREYIRYYIFSLVSECCIYDTTGVEKYLKEYPLSYTMVCNVGTLWKYIRYIILRISPQFYKFLCSVQKIILRK